MVIEAAGKGEMCGERREREEDRLGTQLEDPQPFREEEECLGELERTQRSQEGCQEQSVSKR